MNTRTFFEFFAGGGMARAGLGPEWHCAFANDFDPMKAAVYAENWGKADFRLADVNDLSAADLPGCVDLAWASFPCQDLSLAGNAAGLGSEHCQTRSGAFWAFWRLMQGLIDEQRAPSFIVLENVYGALTANGGRDFAIIGRCLALAGYRFGAVVIDAVDFVPQSRPRVFILGVRTGLEIPESLTVKSATARWHPLAMKTAIDRLSEPDAGQWVWFNPLPPDRTSVRLMDIIEAEPVGVSWHSSDVTDRVISMMTATNRARLDAMLTADGRRIGTIYKRTRIERGNRLQRAEMRDDGIAGCLRTPGGGSSRQIVVVVENGTVRTRLLSAREAARLMGLPDSYRLPLRYNDAYHVAGDGVVVPVVRFVAEALIEPIMTANADVPMLIAAE